MHPKLLVIIGETASGKSELALRLAEQFDGELICADSWTVRREVNIGTAKPSAADRARVPHHLIDVVGPDEDFTAAIFKGLAQQAIQDIASRGKLPIMVGGTGLYIDSVLYDYSFLPAGDRSERTTLNDFSSAQLLSLINERGIELGDVDTRNKRRLIRLIETGGEQPQKQQLRANTLILGLKTDRERIKQRIEKRTDSMLDTGLEDEARSIVDKYGWDCEALKGVGYAQWQGYFEGTQNLAETRQKIIKATLDLAKRQRTWFKRPDYRDTVTAEPPSSGTSVPRSLSGSVDPLRSPDTDLTRRSSAQQQSSHGSPAVRNKSVQWFETPVKWSDVVAAVTTFLEKPISS